MALNLVDIITVKYPGEIEKGNITFRKPLDQELSFDKWNVEGVPKPIEASILAEESQWEKPFAIHNAFGLFIPYLENLLNETAKKKEYGSALHVISYYNSSVSQWAAEAKAFVEWRDAVFLYAIDVQTKVEADQIPIPSLDEFIAGLPVIIWP